MEPKYKKMTKNHANHQQQSLIRHFFILSMELNINITLRSIFHNYVNETITLTVLPISFLQILSIHRRPQLNLSKTTTAQ